MSASLTLCAPTGSEAQTQTMSESVSLFDLSICKKSACSRRHLWIISKLSLNASPKMARCDCVLTPERLFWLTAEFFLIFCNHQCLKMNRQIEDIIHSKMTNPQWAHWQTWRAWNADAELIPVFLYMTNV